MTEDPASTDVERNEEAPESGAGESSGKPTGKADRARAKQAVEALLFSSDRPVSAGRIAQICDVGDGHLVRGIIRELQEEYRDQGRAFGIEEIAGGYQLLTRPEFADYVKQLHERQQQDTLSKAALETLAIVAYRQPIMRAEVEDIRGVQCGHILRSLVEKRLIKVVGRSEDLGRPLLYGTTRQFLEAFGLRSLKDLPKRGKLTQPSGESE